MHAHADAAFSDFKIKQCKHVRAMLLKHVKPHYTDIRRASHNVSRDILVADVEEFKIALLHYEFAILKGKIKPENGFKNFKRIVGYAAFW